MNRNSMVIDLSHYNPLVDAAAMKAAGVVGVILKATQGAGVNDPKYDEHRKMAADAGLLVGAYHFNTGEPVISQVQHFMDAAAPDDATLMALDFEDNRSSQMSVAQAKQFILMLERQLGRNVVIYSGNRVKDLLGATVDGFLGARRLWIPQYGSAPHLQASWKVAWLWQWTEGGSIAGVTGHVDCNSYAGTAEQLAAEWAGAPIAAT